MKKEFVKRLLSSVILIPLVYFFIVEGSYLFNFFVFISFLIISYEWHMMTKKKLYSYFGYVFLIFSFYSIYNLRHNYNVDYGFVLLIISICVLTDSGGYLFGKIFKGPKLTNVSPNKTYSGVFGGYFLSILICYLLYNQSKFFFEKETPELNIILFIFLVSTISQLGDILISYFKRLSKIKDTGKIIPGHGGLLDRVDGMIFAFPFSYIFLSFNL